MATNEYANKIVLGNQTLLDLTIDDVTRNSVLYGIKFHLPSGEPTTGTCEYDMDTSELDAVAAEILSGKMAGVNGQVVTGTMPNRGSQTGGVVDLETPVSILNGYHDGGGAIGIDETEAAKIIPGNIKSGVEILGITGNYSGETIDVQSKNVTPSLTAQTVLPDSGYDYLSQVNVAAIPVTEVDNAAGGRTVTIGTSA